MPYKPLILEPKYNLEKNTVIEFEKTVCSKCYYHYIDVACAKLKTYQEPPSFIPIYWYCENFTDLKKVKII